jgi:hypothetical protein
MRIGVGLRAWIEFSPLMRIIRICALLALAVLTGWGTAANVHINEVMYHPPEDRDELQYVELLNDADTPADISGWGFKSGLKFTFPAKTVIPPHGFVVVCRDLAAFKAAWGSDIPALGNFTGHLKHTSEKMELRDEKGGTVERFTYNDRAPWPMGPDGFSASLERINPRGTADDPHNWAASKPGTGRIPGGTPGRTNDTYSAKALPVIDSVHWNVLPKAGQAAKVTARVKGPEKINQVVLQIQAFTPGRGFVTNELVMKSGGDASQPGQYEAEIPGMAADTLLRFTIKALDHAGAVRIEPGQNEPRAAFSAYAIGQVERAGIPMVRIINPAPVPHGGRKFGPPQRNANVVSERGKSAFFYLPPQGQPELFDFVQVRQRSGGWKVHFYKDQMLDEMSALNIIFEGPSRWILSEHLSYELYKRAGLHTEKSGYFRITMDGQPLGYYLFVEQPNKTFLNRAGWGDKGNLYKLLWYGRGVVGQHEKKTNPGTGHADIASIIDQLGKISGAKQWELIRDQFDIASFSIYYAVNMCIENWDGFFNNYFVYHNPDAGVKWQIIPWDEDKTWGEYDGGPRNYSWYDMPLTIGMKGDTGTRSWFGGGPFGGGAGWWRPPGWFSGPLLGNPEFRKLFLARLRIICSNVFTEEQFGPVVDELHKRLRPEVELRARALHQDPAAALRKFDADIQSFHAQLRHRRAYILKELK